MSRIIRLCLLLYTAFYVSNVQALEIRYSYDGDFGSVRIADSAAAYEGNTLVARARALRIIRKDPGPNSIEIRETHYSGGKVIYEGYVEIEFGFRGGRIISARPISGEKRLNIFTSWPSG